ncbi:MAG: IclR family transcriptional regulator C-terminal domain-containing protein [Tolumonas sp.]|nr:IclR family transcriptional regulator C-terminal domain-containing protein [Tolumonas sp.]
MFCYLSDIYTLTVPPWLSACLQLATVRETGFSEDREEQEVGVRCVAVPVYDRFGYVMAGLSISFPTIRFDEQQLAHYVTMLHQAAANISQQLGLARYPYPAI